jgi:gag-polypeptide of LTR copia-type
MEAILESRDYMEVTSGNEIRPADAAENEDDQAKKDAIKKEQAKFDKTKSKIASLIINSLGDKPLNTIETVSKDPAAMWARLEKQYSSKSVNSKLSLITETQLKRLSHKGDMSDHVAEFETLFAKLENAGFKIETLMQVSIFLASLDTHAEYESTIAAIRTLADDDIAWEIVTTRLREEYKQKQMQHHGQTYRSSNSATVAYVKDNKKTTCSKCGQVGHAVMQCWHNPD